MYPGSRTKKAPASTKCQKCLHLGHYTYECKNDVPYKPRPTRTQQLGKAPKRDKPSVELPDEFAPRKGTAAMILEAKEKERAAERAKRERSASSSSSSSSSSDPDSSSDSDSSDSDSASSSSRSRSRSPRRKSKKSNRHRSVSSDDSRSRSPPPARRSRRSPSVDEEGADRKGKGREEVPTRRRSASPERRGRD